MNANGVRGRLNQIPNVFIEVRLAFSVIGLQLVLPRSDEEMSPLELLRMLGSEGRGAFGVLDHAMPFWRLASRDQMHGAIANEITTANLLERLPQCRPVIGVVVSQKCLVESALFNASDRRNPFAVATHFFKRILFAVIHRRRQGHWGWVERLHLICAELVALEPQGQVDHVIVGGSRVRSDEVGD